MGVRVFVTLKEHISFYYPPQVFVSKYILFFSHIAEFIKSEHINQSTT